MKTNLLRTLTLLLALMATALSANQPGAIDPTFRSGGGVNDEVGVIVRQKDGKLLIGGGFSTVQQYPRSGIARLLPSGVVDLSFNPGAGTRGSVYDIALQPDGKIIIAGSFSRYSGAQRLNLARLNVDGSLDPSFLANAGASGPINKVRLLPNGQMIIAGDFSDVQGIAQNNIARLNANGSLDATFNPGTSSNNTILSMALQSNGQMIIGGFFTSYNGTVRNRLARLNANGSLDLSFDPGAGADNSVKAIAVQPDGKVLIGGGFNLYGGTPRGGLARVNTNGTLDASFDSQEGANDDVESLHLLADGTLLIGGDFTTYNFASRLRIARINADGSRFNNFSGNVASSSDFGTVESILVQPDGKIVIGGSFSDVRQTPFTNLARLTSNGTLDATFNPGAGASNRINAVALQADGKILIGGDFTSYSGAFYKGLARLKPDGSLDPTYLTGTGTNQPIKAMVMQPDGKLIIAGEFTSYNGTPRNRIARIHPDGSVDATFNSTVGANGDIFALALQADGKIIIGGSFTTYDGAARIRVARVNANGSVDATFTSPTGPNGTVNSVAIQNTGKVVIGGLFGLFGANASPRIARVNSDGSYDATFTIGTGPNGRVNALVIQPDNKVLVGGEFDTFDGVTCTMLARLNVNGTLDPTFDSGPLQGDLYSISAMQRLPSGKLLIAGDFYRYNQLASPQVARVMPDGKADTSFITAGTSLGNDVLALALQPDGKVILGGRISSYDGRSVGNITRILTDFNFTSTVFTGITLQAGIEGRFDASLMTGSFTLSLAKSGLYTGALTLGSRQDSKGKGAAEKIALVGAFDKDGLSRISAVRNDGRVLYLDLSLERSNIGATYVEGTLADVNGNEVQLRANAPYFIASTLPANHLAGRYHIALSPAAGITEGALATPAGTGFLVGLVTTAGKMTLTGKKTDGTALTASANIGPDGEVLLYFPIYAGAGSLTGRLFTDVSQFNLENPAPAFTGQFNWRRPPVPLYPSGFTSVILASTQLYLPKATTLSPFGGDAVNSVEVRIAGGHIAAAGLASRVRFTPAGLGVVDAAGQINTLKISIARATGAITGTFIPPGKTKPEPIQGLIATPTTAVGYSLVPGAPGILPSSVILSVLIP